MKFVFNVWLNEFCIIHLKLILIKSILEKSRLYDLLPQTKKLIIPKRSQNIIFIEKHLVLFEETKIKDSAIGKIKKSWNYDGTVYKIETLTNDGKKHGSTKVWYNHRLKGFSEQQLKYDEIYKNNDLEYVAIYFPSGHLQKKEFYDVDSLDKYTPIKIETNNCSVPLYVITSNGSKIFNHPRFTN